ncbi:MAG: hypothetical protein C5B54_07035 [Acidobacteria bacterium]|nr:MAG: hypothetical protein C5B54_07035 [Acidobacteriota bacterium]
MIFVVALFLFFFQTASADEAASTVWSQWGKDSQHSGRVHINGQSVNSILSDVTYDPFVAQEQQQSEEDLLVHYQAVLIGSNDIYMEFKSGQFTGVAHWETQVWNERRFVWNNGSLQQSWNFPSDWKPVPFRDPLTKNGPAWEPVFHAALTLDSIYIPGAGGTIYRVKRTDGTLIARINPFGARINSQIFTVGPLAVRNGVVYYNAIQLTASAPWRHDIVDAWLVKVTNNIATKVRYATLIPNAPRGNDSCTTGFSNGELPWPPTPNAVAPLSPCGSQRPAINAAPAIANDGTIYTISRAHFNNQYGYLVAINPNLTLRWAASLRNHLNDGCNVLIPANGTPGGCIAGATTGVDPATNQPPAARVSDDSSASPTIAPDGTILYGAYTRYNFSQGHLMQFGRSGNFLHSYLFGWDSTPGIYTHDGTYSIILKENHYSTGSYCNNFGICPFDRTDTYPQDPESYFITQLSPTLQVEWQYRNVNTESCIRNSDNSVSCANDHPNSFEWCVNAVAIDSNGDTYANSEDGNLYVISQGGTLKQNLFQKLAIGAAYTPVSIGPNGLIYTQNDGQLFIVGQ